MERCTICGRELDPATWACPVCEGEGRVPPPRPYGSYSAGVAPLAAAGTEVPRLPSPLPSGNDPARLAEAKRLGWNWGAFLIPYLWLLGHGRLGAGLFMILTSFVPFLGFLHVFLYPAAGLYLGFNGYELAWRHQPYHSLEQLRDREREWTLWGVVLVVIGILGLIFFAIYMRVIVEEALRGMEDLGL